MSEDRKEQVSALVDGEIGAASRTTLGDLLTTPILRESWARYHLISDSLRQQLPDAIDTALAARISAEIDAEPHMLFPFSRTKPAFLKPLAGFAIAASIAALAIITIQPSEQAATSFDQAVVSFTPRDAGVNTPASQATLASTNETQLREMEARARLNRYLVNYNEYQTNSGFQGMLPYARTVTFENNQ